MNVNKKTITHKIAKVAGVSQEKTLEIINLFLNEVIEQFQAGNTVELREFGTFYPYLKKSRVYIIPRLKEEHIPKSHITMKFKPSRSVRIYEDSVKRGISHKD